MTQTVSEKREAGKVAVGEVSVRQQFGSAAHFIGSEDCRFHITTLIGEYVISTVGDYAPRHRVSTVDERPMVAGGRSVDAHTIGYERYFETMVFKTTGPCDCGCGLPDHSGSNIDFAGYQTRAEANAGHEAMCQKYEALPRYSE